VLRYHRSSNLDFRKDFTLPKILDFLDSSFDIKKSESIKSSDIFIIEPLLLPSKDSITQYIDSIVKNHGKDHKLVIWHPAELYHWALNSFVINALEAHEYPPENVFTVSGDYYKPSQPKYFLPENILYFPYFAYKTSQLNLPEKVEYKNKKKFILPIYSPRPARRYLLHYLDKANLLDLGHVSCTREETLLFDDSLNGAQWILPAEEVKQVYESTLKLVPATENNFSPTEPLVLDRNNIQVSESWNHSDLMSTLTDFYRSSDFVISPESSVNFVGRGTEPTGFITEKTFIPIMLNMPFVIHGEKHSLKSLQDQGYETFYNYIDESYDNADDIYTRTTRLIDTVNNMCYIEDWNMIKDIVEHNRNHMLNVGYKACLDEIFEKILGVN